MKTLLCMLFAAAIGWSCGDAYRRGVTDRALKAVGIRQIVKTNVEVSGVTSLGYTSTNAYQIVWEGKTKGN